MYFLLEGLDCCHIRPAMMPLLMLNYLKRVAVVCSCRSISRVWRVPCLCRGQGPRIVLNQKLFQGNCRSPIWTNREKWVIRIQFLCSSWGGNKLLTVLLCASWHLVRRLSRPRFGTGADRFLAPRGIRCQNILPYSFPGTILLSNSSERR